MGLRPARTIRDPDKVPWTRWSKRVMRKSYIKAMPHKDIHHFNHGKESSEYDISVRLVAENSFYHRDNALEAARKVVVRLLEKHAAGKFFFQIRKYPHHIIRENRMVAGAGADRIQSGMKRAFGKPTDRAALVEKGDTLFYVETFKDFEDIVREAFRRASRKLSGTWKIIVERRENYAG